MPKFLEQWEPFDPQVLWIDFCTLPAVRPSRLSENLQQLQSCCPWNPREVFLGDDRQVGGIPSYSWWYVVRMEWSYHGNILLANWKLALWLLWDLHEMYNHLKREGILYETELETMESHGNKLKVHIRPVGILHICNLWIRLRKIVIYLVVRKLYLRWRFCC